MKRTLAIVALLVVVTSLTLAGVALADTAGTVTIRDDKALSDKIEIALTGLPAVPAGRAYVGWLVSDDGKTMVNTGALTVGGDGSVTTTFTSPKGENLAGLYNKFSVTSELQADVAGTAPKGTVVAQAVGAPTQALMHVRHVIYQWDAAPNKTGLGVGTLTQAKLLSQHAHLLQDALKANNLASAKGHAEHVVNIVEGSKGPNFGDRNGDGAVQNPGDGFGLLEYAKGAGQHATFAATTPDASSYVKLHSMHVADTAENVVGWATIARDRALDVLKAADVTAATPIAAELVKNADLALNGNSTKPTKGEGGAMTTYEHAQNMSGFNVVALGAASPTAMAMQPAATVQPAATAQPVAAGAPTTLPKSGERFPVELFGLLGAAAVIAGLTMRRWAHSRSSK
jgi:hypothetical protein